MDVVVSPYLLLACLAVGGFGVSLALPRPKFNAQVIGALLAGLAVGGLLLALGLNAGAERPGFYFYVFAILGLGGSLRVITHPKPVYAALYFVMTILSSAALYLMLHAEFLAFALIIIYAGAILITYLFVIMLAEQSPSDQELGAMSDFDRFSREPVVATVVGFALLGALTAMMARGVGAGELVSTANAHESRLIEQMPRKVIRAIERTGAFAGLARPAVADVATLVDWEAGTIELRIRDLDKYLKSLEWKPVAELFGDENGLKVAKMVLAGDVITVGLPKDLEDENLEGVGFALIAGHPMALELAGVILLMAMLGAVVLARKQIEIGEEEKKKALGAGQ